VLRRGLSPLTVTICTEIAAPVLAGVRLRAGRAGSAKGAASMVSEAINTAKDGTILVGGQGKLLRLSSEGKVLHQADSPHATAINENQDKLRTEAENQIKGSMGNLGVQIETYERIINELTEKAKKEELNDQENQILEMLPAQLEVFKKQQAERGDEDESKISEKQIADKMAALTTQKSRVASISTDGKYTYVATPALVGYTFDVWKMDDKFENGEIVVADLRGCCGQMDVQACEAGIFVATAAEFQRIPRVLREQCIEIRVAIASRVGIELFPSFLAFIHSMDATDRVHPGRVHNEPAAHHRLAGILGRPPRGTAGRRSGVGRPDRVHVRHDRSQQGRRDAARSDVLLRRRVRLPGAVDRR
jgi:hypothetical protein